MNHNNSRERHKIWVRTTHWIVTLSFLLLVFTGYEILMVHPRLYWGEVGNDLTPALFELPISRNHQHGGWEEAISFTGEVEGPISMSRTYDIFNQNGWGRSLHFLAGWFLVFGGLAYMVTGLFSGHFRRHIWLKRKEDTIQGFWRDMLRHFRLEIERATGGPHYGLLQRGAYSVIIFFVMPLAVMTGLTMSPAVTAAFPFLLKIFLGAQSARTIHFFTAVILLMFLLVHVMMIIMSGFKKQILYMTIGKKDEKETTDHPA